MKKNIIGVALALVVGVSGFLVGCQWGKTEPSDLNSNPGSNFSQIITNTTPIDNSFSTSRSDMVEDYMSATATVVIKQTLNNVTSSVSFGSGIAIYAGGYIATNYHVISKVATSTNGQYSISILCDIDGKQTEAKANLLWYDNAYDLAVIRSEYVNMPYVQMSDRWVNSTNHLRIAEEIWTLSTPATIELPNSYSQGYISSAVGRNMYCDGNIYQDLIQHTAPISSGSSGSGLFDANGYLLGLNTMGLVSTSNADRNSIYFATPIYPLTKIISKIAYLDQDGDPSTNYSYPKLGITVYDSIYVSLIPSSYPENAFKGTGLYVSTLTENGAAQSAGLPNNIAIIGIESVGASQNTYFKIQNRNDFTNALINFSSGDTIKVYYTDVVDDNNGENTQDLNITLG